jgi:hypothetical protein
MGYAVPDIRIKFDGALFEASSHQFAYKNPNVRFWAGPSEILTRVDAEKELDGFIESVLLQLRDSGLKETSAALRWKRVKESRTDLEEAVFCEAAGALGVDPYQVSDADAVAISSAADLFAGESLNEFLAGAKRWPGLSGQDSPLDKWSQCRLSSSYVDVEPHVGRA